MLDLSSELVFHAKMISDMSQDDVRTFAINYDIKTKQISINEGKTLTSPNGGRFLAKQTKYNYTFHAFI